MRYEVQASSLFRFSWATNVAWLLVQASDETSERGASVLCVCVLLSSYWRGLLAVPGPAPSVMKK
jgi:hypothetical protein